MGLGRVHWVICICILEYWSTAIYSIQLAYTREISLDNSSHTDRGADKQTKYENLKNFYLIVFKLLIRRLIINIYSLCVQSHLATFKVIMQGKLLQRCTHLLYCSVLSLGGNVNTRRMSQPDRLSAKICDIIHSIFYCGQ